MDLTYMYATFLLFCDPVNPLHPNISIHILYTLLFLYISFGTDKENLFNLDSHVLYSHNLKEWFSSDTVRRK